MRPLHALVPHSEIVVSTGTPKHDRRLSDKILAAFGHAYAEGAPGVAAMLRRALEEVEGAFYRAPAGRCAAGALAQADLWVAYVDSRDAFRRASAARTPDPEALEQARAEMMDAYKRWSYG